MAFEQGADSCSGVVTCVEHIGDGPARALAGLFNLDAGPIVERALPALWHWVYLLERPSQSALGPDGHPSRGAIPMPPGPGRRRMFAGGRVWTRNLLRCGAPATRRSRVVSTEDKDGRSGRLTFVTVRHDIEQGGMIVVTDEQDIVYRDAAPAAGTPPVTGAAGSVPPIAIEMSVDATMLFRFSALTYNAHRIHYDRQYATSVEGYPGLVVHGPLQALAMAESARSRLAAGGATRFDYRLVSPLFVGDGMYVAASLKANSAACTVCDRTGRVTARGRLSRWYP